MQPCHAWVHHIAQKARGFFFDSQHWLQSAPGAQKQKTDITAGATHMLSVQAEPEAEALKGASQRE